ncbi:endonuclease/exonuclease/phosphatase family protein [Streptomyces fructofermentans]|uniref:endonuclease/exonuclease/phosphatase family protein n=1 Tax=Streptomyces fructofermentans TaxID=152141 RepID=UPI001E65C8DC|nr:endonuclease/exonuclease/phosphatase family protein [Streptomyces fructofermentans]
MLPTRRRGRARAVRAAAALLLTGVGAVVGSRAADTDAVTPVPQLLAFLPWLLAPTAAALLLAALARWRTGLVWGVATLAAVAWFIEPYGKTSAPPGPAVARVRVLTSNVEFGRATDPLVEAIGRQDPDIVFVQECDHGCADTLRRTLSGDGDGGYPYRQEVVGAGSEGSVILSRHPLDPAAGIPATMGMPGATADVRGHRIRLQLAHPMPPLPGHLSTWRSELSALRDRAAANRARPTVLAGDFNATQDHAAFRRILDAGYEDAARLTGAARTPSWPAATAPPLGAQIDHVLVSRDFSASRARFLDLADTDHRALVVDLTLHRRR